MAGSHFHLAKRSSSHCARTSSSPQYTLARPLRTICVSRRPSCRIRVLPETHVSRSQLRLPLSHGSVGLHVVNNLFDGVRHDEAMLEDC